MAALVLTAAPLSSPPTPPPLPVSRAVLPDVSALPSRAALPPAAWDTRGAPAARRASAGAAVECRDVARAPVRTRWIPATTARRAETSAAIWIPADAPRHWVPGRRAAHAGEVQTP
jgi:hypothetical protein